MCNFNKGVTGFLDPKLGRVFKESKNICILHEGIEDYQQGFYDYFLFGDPNWSHANDFKIAIPRVLFDYTNSMLQPEIPTFSTFGFAYPGKNYAAIVDLVQKEYDEAIIKIHIPANDVIGDNYFRQMLAPIDAIKKPGINVQISKNFLNRNDLLDFLGSNTANIFIYDKQNDLDGISSVIDYGLSCKRPMIVNKNSLFRHVYNRHIIAGENSIKEIVAAGTAPFEDLYENWSQEANLRFYEHLFERII
jgi:hypothetical protein